MANANSTGVQALTLAKRLVLTSLLRFCLLTLSQMVIFLYLKTYIQKQFLRKFSGTLQLQLNDDLRIHDSGFRFN